jgi:hypothetical protein
MYRFLLNLWLLHKINEDDIDLAVEKGIIDSGQASQIKLIPR